MKQCFAILMSIVIAGITATLWYASVHAQATPMTDAHIQRIRTNCVETQSILSQLHASDVGLRVNRGQLYESISTKLMAPFNSRVTLNKYDGSKLIEQSTKYEQALNEFRVNYKSYDDAISKALRINCTNEPVAFYDSVTEARGKRTLVHQSVVKVQSLIQAYKAEFEAFAAGITEKTE
jgi:hypothetical protein